MADPRVTPARGDIAAKFLEGQVESARFVEGETFIVNDAIAPVRAQPFAGAEQITQAIKGELITIYDRNEGWAWGQLEADNYVGWLPDAALAKPATAPTHHVSATRTFAFPGPSIKLPPVETLVLGSRFALAREHDNFALTSEGWFVPKQHVVPLGTIEPDFVAVAERFVGTPYLWGGKSSFGIDCSGLVQISINAAGLPCPRDSDMQQAAIGRSLHPDDARELHRGDLIFWSGHVAIVRDAGTIVHANAFHMATAIEATQAAITRIKATGSQVLAIKRLSYASASSPPA